MAGVLLGLWASSARAETHLVGVGDNLQLVLNDAQPGDVILLQAGATFSGNFKLPAKQGSAPIVVRSSTPDASLPGPGLRIDPSYAPLLPKLRSPNNVPVLQTAPGASNWILRFLEFQANKDGYSDIIRLGTATQSADEVPHDIVIDRCYIHGDPRRGQKNAVVLNSGATTITGSWITDAKAVGQESHAIIGYNGPGPFTIENNRLEGAGINVIFGGANPSIPGLVPTGIVIRHNHITKPLSWRDPIFGTPEGVTATPEPGGKLAAGSWVYRIAARGPVGQGGEGTSLPSDEIIVTVPGPASAVRLSWAHVDGAEGYRVYRRASGSSTWTYFTVQDGVSFLDTGAAGTSGKPPSSATRWTVKNLFELKIGQDVVVEHNLLENNWTGAGDQPGYAILLRSDPATDTGAPWTVVQRVLIAHNIIRSSPGGVNIIGIDGGGAGRQAIRANHITIRDNLFDDLVPSRWGGGNTRFASVIAADYVTFDHNTVFLDGHGILDSGSSYGRSGSNGFVFTNNTMRRGTYGVKGASTAEGVATLDRYFAGWTFAGNVIADLGSRASAYPSGNTYVTTSAWRSAFVNYDASDYRWKATGGWAHATTDGRPVGADLSKVGPPAVNALPIVSVVWPVSRPSLEPLRFDASGSVDPDGTIVEYAWNWGDGTPPTVAASPVVTHTFPKSGNFTVTVTVKDNAGGTAIGSNVIGISNRPPQPLVAPPAPVHTQDLVSLDASGSVDPDGSIVQYVWDFGDGTAPVATAVPYAAHAYADANTYVVRVTVVDNFGASTAAFASVAVLNRAPVAVPGGPCIGLPGSAIVVDGAASYDPDGTIAGARWLFTDEVIIRASDIGPADIHGRWALVTASGAAGGIALHNPNRGEGKRAASARPVNYVEARFVVAPGVPYRLWIRMRAEGNSWANDSVSVQFSGAVTAAGTPIYRIGTTSAASVILEEGNGAGVAGWGWADHKWEGTAEPIVFSQAYQTIRIQQREDGVMFDQIVLSSAEYADQRPGALKMDETIIPEDFGTGEGLTLSHEWRVPGVYPVQLTVVDDAGEASSAWTTVTVR